jgi:hypothetical protein
MGITPSGVVAVRALCSRFAPPEAAQSISNRLRPAFQSLTQAQPARDVPQEYRLCYRSGMMETHIAAVRALYKPIVAGETSRLGGGRKLWAQFENAADSCRDGNRAAILALIERLNELAVAMLILNNQELEGELHYEPDIIPDGRRIDFVVFGASENTYIEVKTISPQADDSDSNWQKQVARSKRHPENVHNIVSKEWLGAQIYENSFRARGHFLDYTRQFETRLAAANTVHAGSGLLVFCGDGSAWHLSELEDFPTSTSPERIGWTINSAGWNCMNSRNFSETFRPLPSSSEDKTRRRRNDASCPCVGLDCRGARNFSDEVLMRASPCQGSWQPR